jgi:hypothetical protein
MPRRRGAQSRRRANGAGLGTLIVGLILASAGVYLFTNQVDVGAGPFGGVAWFGPNSFGLLLVPLLLGVGLLCVDFGSRIGKLLVAIGAVILLASVLNTFRITFRTTSLFNTLMMLGLSISGVGLMARALLGWQGSSTVIEDVDTDDDMERARLRVELASAQDRIRALEAPRANELETAVSKQPTSVDDDLADLVRRKQIPKADG